MADELRFQKLAYEICHFYYTYSSAYTHYDILLGCRNTDSY